MGAAYPELHKSAKHVEQGLLQEEERFAETLEQGMRSAGRVPSQDSSDQQIPGEIIFKLYDTYGFPADLTTDIARERGLTLDLHGFEREMEKQRERGRAASQFGAEYGSGRGYQERDQIYRLRRT